jgi:superfamily II helicase
MNILEAQMADVEHQGKEARRKVEKARRAAALMQRAQDLDRAEGKPVNDAMTVKQAVERLREAGKLSKEDFL